MKLVAKQTFRTAIIILLILMLLLIFVLASDPQLGDKNYETKIPSSITTSEPQTLPDAPPETDTPQSNFKTNLPEYWLDYLEGKINDITQKDALIGAHGDSFIFITDTHVNRNKMYSPILIEYIAKNTSVGKVINGGDILDNESSASNAMYKLLLWRNAMANIKEYRVMGNHDLNRSGQLDPTAYLTEDNWYGLMVKPFEEDVSADQKSYFCVDNEVQKVRLICIQYYFNAGSTEEKWICDKLTEKGEDWTILVINHHIFDANEKGKLHAHGEKLIKTINGVYSDIKANFIGILAGHSHYDYATTETTNGYHLITTTCDAYRAEGGGLVRTKGTVAEQAFDVVHIDTKERKMYLTRIGAGEDRTFLY